MKLQEAKAFMEALQLDSSKSYVQVYEETNKQLEEIFQSADFYEETEEEKERFRFGTNWKRVEAEGEVKHILEEKLFAFWKDHYSDYVEQAKGFVQEGTFRDAYVYFACYRRAPFLFVAVDKAEAQTACEALFELQLVRRGALEYFYFIEKWSEELNVPAENYKKDYTVLDCYLLLNYERTKATYAEALGKYEEVIGEMFTGCFTPAFVKEYNRDFWRLCLIWKNEKKGEE